MSALRWLKDLRFALFYRLLLRRGVPLATLGAECQWTLTAPGLGPASRVLCAGAGHDISFEKTLIENYGCHVVLLDPSPTGIATVARAALPAESLTFLPVALADTDGELAFQEPADAEEGSFLSARAGGVATRRFPCKSLPTLMAEHNWPQIDLLKIDIEGAEYGVLRQIVERQLSVRQICVEFHHGPGFGRGAGETVRAILALRRAGYDLIHRVYWDHTFLRRDG